MNLSDIQKLIYEKMIQVPLRYPTQHVSILDDYALYDQAEPPYIILSDLVLVENNTKNTDGMVVQQYINIYSTYQGKKEILDIVQEVSDVMNFSMNTDTGLIYTKQGTTTIMSDTSNKGLFASDKKYDKSYQAVMIFKIYINE